MIRKTVQKEDLDGYSEIRQNLEYWLSRPPAERLAAVMARLFAVSRVKVVLNATPGEF